MKKIKLITLNIFLLAIGKLGAWGEQGHGIVASIAKKTLQKQIVDSVQTYLGSTTFRQAALWMDEIKKDKKYRYMDSWHYINLEKDEKYEKSEQVNIVTKLQESIEIVKNRKKYTKSEVNTALKIIFHLVGDIHQPLHCGYGSDKGGNSIKLDFMGRNSNLHRVWDSDIINHMKIGVKNCLETANNMNESEKKKLQNTNVEAWMWEARELLPQVYDYSDAIISLPYLNKNSETIKSQLAKAGIRLAYILHYCFT